MPGLNEAVIRNLAKIPGVHVLVIFDEIDKFPANDSRLTDLFEITNACSECNFQLVATSNHSPAELAKRWNSLHAEPILRRFHDDTGDEHRILLHCTCGEPETPPTTVSTRIPATPDSKIAVCALAPVQ